MPGHARNAANPVEPQYVSAIYIELWWRATEVNLSESLRDRFLTAASSRAAQTVLAENDVGLPFWRLILYAPAASQRE